MVRWPLLKIIALVLAAAGIGAAQRESPFSSRPATLRVKVTVDDDSAKAAHVTVDLMDALNSGSAMDSKLTDNDGNVVFQTITGSHRIRITGPNIQTYEAELEIARNESLHMERIRVHAAPGSQPALPQPAFLKSSVPAVRLN